MNERAGSHGLVGGCLAPATQAQCLLGPLTGGLSPPQLRCDLSHLDSRAPGLRLLRLSSWIRLAGIVSQEGLLGICLPKETTSWNCPVLSQKRLTSPASPPSTLCLSEHICRASSTIRASGNKIMVETVISLVAMPTCAVTPAIFLGDAGVDRFWRLRLGIQKLPEGAVSLACPSCPSALLAPLAGTAPQSSLPHCHLPSLRFPLSMSSSNPLCSLC